LLSIIAFILLILAFGLSLVRWRIQKKQRNWLKKGNETHNFRGEDDEVTITFNGTDDDDDDDDDENGKEQLSLNRLHENLKWALDYIIYDEDKEDEQRDFAENIGRKNSNSVVEAYNSFTLRRGGFGGETTPVPESNRNSKSVTTQ